ncbi:hypothetical protein [Streptomyces sp. NRRL B-1347]|uniref:hypothetical protein n=1 Tax=Streptomyces sp. NRRL B-1347 TaxID=1476877 RepID=UPI0004C52B01|nr:hypothetical protein [Streptomyces sp. NRRL B-1347]
MTFTVHTAAARAVEPGRQPGTGAARPAVEPYAAFEAGEADAVEIRWCQLEGGDRPHAVDVSGALRCWTCTTRADVMSFAFQAASVPEPFGPLYVRPGQPDCPNCQCCTEALCERGRSHLMGCVAHVDKEHTSVVTGCPCSSMQTRGTLAFRVAAIRAVRTALERPLGDVAEDLLRALADGTPLRDPGGIMPQLAALNFVQFHGRRPGLTDFGALYLEACTEPRHATPLVVHDVDLTKRTAQVTVAAWSTTARVTVPLDQLTYETGLVGQELVDVPLECYVNVAAAEADMVVVTNISTVTAPAAVVDESAGGER